MVEMHRAQIEGLELTYQIVGDGEPVVFIHGAFIADIFRPLVAEISNSGRYRCIQYRRRGYGDVGDAATPMSMGEQAADCRRLLDHLALDQVHVVGHSFGGSIALQLALDAPHRVRTLALLEPAWVVGESAPSYRDSLLTGRDRFRTSGPEVVVDAFLSARWPAYRHELDRALPDAFAQALIDARVSFDADIPGLLGWQLQDSDLQTIDLPVLSVLGGESDAESPRHREAHELLLRTLPCATRTVIPGVMHFLGLVEQPQLLARVLQTFWAYHSTD